MQKQFSIDVKIVHNQLSISFIAGLKILDILRNPDWSHKVFQQSFSKKFLEEIINDLIDVSFEDYGLRNLQAQIIARSLQIVYSHHKPIMADLVENLTDIISDSDNKYQLDALLRTLVYLLEKIEDEV